MDRDTVLKDILGIRENNILIELPTGTGKSKIALEVLKRRNIISLLIVVPRNVLKDNWKEELEKWWPNNGINILFSTYVSFPKHAGKYDAVIFDECHRLSERCMDALESFSIKYSILLSATVKNSIKDSFKRLFNNLYCYRMSVKSAVENSILPEPRIILLPLRLDNRNPDCTIEINPKAKGAPVTVPWSRLWNARRDKSRRYLVTCTQSQKYLDMCRKIEWYKNKRYLEYMANKWLHACGERLKWLSDLKKDIIPLILKRLSNQRTLTFCASIEQTEWFGKYCINSKNKDSQRFLDMFNAGKINHITAANMLNEGLNLTSCRVGIYTNLNSSDTIIIQRMGRILRHREPVIIIPYFKFTREEELVNKMLENYDSSLVETINSINEIDL